MSRCIKLKNIAIAQSEFFRLREHDDYVYVDKTDILAKLALKKNDAQYFISRPRRFGKSLMLSTLRYMFEGRRELFRGLKIEKTKWDWSKTYPVVMLDMSVVKGKTPLELEKNLFSAAKRVARRFSLSVPWSDCGGSGYAFALTLDALEEKFGDFVVLVDEYDTPLQGFLGTDAINQVRQIMHDFYVQLKNHMGSIRFLMITGVTKLTKLSLFSGLNNPIDLTMDEPICAGLLGYTKEEIETCFAGHLKTFAKKNRISSAKALEELLAWYDSYRFCPDSNVRVCNPISIGKALQTCKLKSYWIKTASASLLVERMRALNASVRDFDNVLASDDELDVCDAVEMPLVPLAYQSGYLTIKGKSRTERDSYGNPKLILGVPNHEVRGALNGIFWETLMRVRESDFKALVHVAEKQIADGDIDGLVCKTLYRLYAKLPPTWTPKCEADAKRYFLLFMEMAGAKMHAEEASARGFADAVIETKKGVWIFEFKFNRSAASAIRQIRERGYADAYVDATPSSHRSLVDATPSSHRSLVDATPPSHRSLVDATPPSRHCGNDRPITLVGVKFDPKIKNIDIPKFEAL